ncbi:MAG: chromate transporter [Butyricicoccus sp.]
MILLRLFYEFFKVGLFSIGGGLATLPFLYDISDKTGWFTHTDITNLIAISESTPGPIGVNAATYVGFLTHGFVGAMTSTLGLIAPSIVVIILVSRVLERFRDSRLVDDLFYGLRPASTGLIASAGFLVVKSTFFAPTAASLSIRWPQVVLAVVLYAAIKKFNKHPIVYIAAAAVIGVIFHFAG